MIIQKFLALIALLTSLSGCAGADAVSLPTVEAGEAVPYMDPAALIDIEREADGQPAAPSETPHGAADAAPSPGKEPAVPAEGTVTADATPLYTAFSPYSGKSLKPRDDYGHLLPYLGGMAAGGYPLWGLVTDDGQVVTDPAYGQIKPYGPFFLLYKTDETVTDGDRLTLCGKDGSWTMDAWDFHHSILLDGIGLAAAREDGSVIILNSDGAAAHTFTRAQLEPYLGAGYSWDDDDFREICYAGGPVAVCRWDENSPYGNGTAYDCFMDPVTGELTSEPPAEFEPENGFGDLDEDPSFPGYDYPERLEDITTGTVYYWCERSGVSDLLDSRGNVLAADFFTPGPGLWEPVVGSGMLGTLRDGAFQYARINDGEVVFRYPLR